MGGGVSGKGEVQRVGRVVGGRRSQWYILSSQIQAGSVGSTSKLLESKTLIRTEIN